MIKSTAAAYFASFATALVVPIFMLTPPLDVGDSPGNARTARHMLSTSAEAGRQVFSGSCESCHGIAGRGGSAPALSGQSFARDFLQRRELHDRVSAPIPGHEKLVAALGRPNGMSRFNQVELIGKFLREVHRNQ